RWAYPKRAGSVCSACSKRFASRVDWGGTRSGQTHSNPGKRIPLTHSGKELKLGGSRSVFGWVVRQLANDEFLQNIVRGGRANPNERVFKRHRHIAVAFGIVQIRDAPRGQAAKKSGVTGLPVSVVTFTDHRVGNRVEKPRPPATAAFVKKPRILFEERWEDCAADERAGNRVGVGRAQTLSVALRALSISAERICRLLNSGNGCRHANVYRVYGELPRQLEFLPRVQRNG